MTSPILDNPSTRQQSVGSGQTRLRLRIIAAEWASVIDVLKELKACCGINLQVLPTQGLNWCQPSHTVNLDLQGPLIGIQQALRRLQAFPITIQGRANPDGDGWYC
ncbi:MAG TPA: hypothetical protein V6D29_01515 [Leptolyngbyaceae cyanobacterium]